MILFPTPSLTQSQIMGAYFTPFDTSGCGNVSAIEAVEAITVPVYGAFKRVNVNYMYKGVTYVFWEMNENFTALGTLHFQLQGSQSGTPRGEWFDIGSTTTLFFATDDGGVKLQRMFGKSPTLIYRVKVNIGDICYISPIANVLGSLNKHDWLIVREILRKEQLSHRIFSSVKGYLFKGRRYGTKCTASRDTSVKFSAPDGTNTATTNEIIDTNCTICFGTGFVDGYFPSTEYYCLLNNESTREARGAQGTMKPVVVQGRFLATLPLVQGDVWVNSGSDERYYIHSVKETASWKSVPIVYEAELRLAPFTDAIYDIPITLS